MKEDLTEVYLRNVKTLFKYYKELGSGALEQVSEDEINLVQAEDGNSIAVIIKHLHGNMKSRFTDFLNSDGEKSWRDRDGEFEDTITSKSQLLDIWNEGWSTVFQAIDPLRKEDLDRIVYIRNEGHSIIEALNRQLGHYAYHVGQIVHLAKSYRGREWKSLSIPKGQSKQFNKEKFDSEKRRQNFV